MPRLSSTGLRARPARLSSEKFCILRAPAMHAFGHGKSLFAAFNGAWPGDNRQLAATDGDFRAGEADHGIVFFHVAAYQLVRLADANDFLHPGEFFQADLNQSLIAG